MASMSPVSATTVVYFFRDSSKVMIHLLIRSRPCLLFVLFGFVILLKIRRSLLVLLQQALLRSFTSEPYFGSATRTTQAPSHDPFPEDEGAVEFIEISPIFFGLR